MKLGLAFGVTLFPLVLFGTPVAGDEASPARFEAIERWAPAAALPIDANQPGLGAGLALSRLIGKADIVVLGEALHGSREPLEVRNALFKHLVKTMGFTAIAIESGIVEGFTANDYVQGSPGTAQEAASRGITFGLNALPQQAELLEWMRAYNADPGNGRKIAFYGMDVSVPASTEQPQALDLALAYLGSVDAARAAALQQRIAPHRDFLTIDRRGGGDKDYTRLPQPARDAVTAAIADLLTELATHEGAYGAATGAATFDRGYRLAVAAQQADAYLRQFPVGWKPADGPVLSTVAVADRAKSDNIDWIMGRHERILMFSHFGHAVHTPVSVAMPGASKMMMPPMVGTYLQRHYGDRALVIGQLIGDDRTSCTTSRPPAAEQSLEAVLRRATKSDAALLDLRQAPAAVRARLVPPHDLYGQQPTHSLSIGSGAEVILFTRAATPAIPCTIAGKN
jgi:erythromycin esterase